MKKEKKRNSFFTRVELFRETGIYLLADCLISFLFFRSWKAVPMLLPGLFLWLRERRNDISRIRTDEKRSQFMISMQLVNMSLLSGSAFENAVRNALPELKKLYGDDSFIAAAFSRMTGQFARNINAETALEEFAAASDVEEIRDFVEVFRTARRTGGDLCSILRNTIAGMQQREETMKEIETVLSGKIMEQRIMSIIPLFILAYSGITSPETMDAMYHTGIGRVIMGIALVMYTGAFLMGRHILEKVSSSM